MSAHLQFSPETPCAECGKPGRPLYGVAGPGRQVLCQLHESVTRIQCSGGDSINLVRSCSDRDVLSLVATHDSRATIRRAAAARIKQLNKQARHE